ncbi:MAG: Crp/Fnr family transcriptional regulator [Anaerolineae bacterium]
MSKATSRGRRQIFCNSITSSCDGLCLLAFGERALADVYGLTDSAVLLVPSTAFLPLARQDAVLCQGAWQCAAACMAHLSDLVTQLSFNTVAERLVSALYNGTHVNGDVMRLTQAELAASVGTTREVAARCLADLQASGAIRLGRGRITVLDREQLAVKSEKRGTDRPAF